MSSSSRQLAAGGRGSWQQQGASAVEVSSTNQQQQQPAASSWQQVSAAQEAASNSTQQQAAAGSRSQRRQPRHPRASARDCHLEPHRSAQDECNASEKGPHRLTIRLRGASGELPRATLRPRAIQRCGTGGTAPRPPASPGEHARPPRKGSTAPDSIVFLNDAIFWFPRDGNWENPAGRTEKCRPPVTHITPTCHHSIADVDTHVSPT